MIHRPSIEETTGYQRTYIDQVEGNDMFEALSKNTAETLELINSIAPEKADYRYADGKWSVKEVLGHIIDTERIFAFRALAFLRKDKSELPGFEEGDYVANYDMRQRSLNDLREEYDVVRKSTILLLNNAGSDHLDFKGKANGLDVSARILGWMIAGHNIHHNKVIRERYL
jgi:uncharacterized damage-inducible protein DinB